MRFTTTEIVNIIRIHGSKTLEELREYDKERGLCMKPVDYERALTEATENGVLKKEGDKYVYSVKND
jgi:hypothetical protein